MLFHFMKTGQELDMTRLYEFLCNQSGWTWHIHAVEAESFLKSRSFGKLLCSCSNSPGSCGCGSFWTAGDAGGLPGFFFGRFGSHPLLTLCLGPPRLSSSKKLRGGQAEVTGEQVEGGREGVGVVMHCEGGG